eukprot:Phypoly_transcript_05495.p1 GENE.Phypoly_transcript_05495~~Phypoly_transcript_05495.p1  ORF type:complete len:563 (+),score=87.53 Phypoly_transcript_05495:133-1821(+)
MAEEDAEVPQGYIEDEEQDKSESPKDPQERDAERGFTEEELAICTKVLDALGRNPAILNRRDYRDVRRAAGVFINGMEKKYYDGTASAAEFKKQRDNKLEKNRIIQKKKDLDREKIAKTKLRSMRTEYLNKLLEPPQNLLIEGPEDIKPKSLEEELKNPRSCYICKCRFFDLHHFYDQLCPKCSAISWHRRTRMVDLSNKIALVTGARVKIGLQVGLRLLRCGCDVHVTTRFPHDAAIRYSQQPDFEKWKNKLHIHGLDLRDLRAVERFCAYLVATLPRLDIIINNAAQTIRRNPQYYEHLMNTELLPIDQLPPQVQTLVKSNMHFVSETTDMLLGVENKAEETKSEAEPAKSEAVTSPKGKKVASSAALSQVPLTEEDFTVDKSLFPKNQYDVHDQQIDLRKHNSWLLRLHEVPTIEVVEVTAVNAIAPFILIRSLKPLMMHIPEEDKFVINVSAMEGKFYRFKTVNHPHTNMAKASLNMMTRTSADDFVRDRIYMNCVDTGWITDENPHDKAQEIAATGFQTPIDEQEASSRIIDPIFSAILDGVKEHGKFYKDYLHSEW